MLTDRYGKGEEVGYPTICKGRYQVGNDTFYAIEEPTSLNALGLLPELIDAIGAGVASSSSVQALDRLIPLATCDGYWRGDTGKSAHGSHIPG